MLVNNESISKDDMWSDEANYLTSLERKKCYYELITYNLYVGVFTLDRIGHNFGLLLITLLYGP